VILTVTLNPAVDETLVVHQLQLGETNRIKETDLDPGGKGLNVARVVKRLGRPVVGAMLLGGETGHFIRNRLAREGVDIAAVEIAGKTRVNISVFDESSGVQTNLNHEGPHVDASELHAFESKLGEWLPEAVIMAVGGSLPPGAPTDIYAKMIEWARASDVRTILDSSGDALVEGIKARPYMIKPNIHEAENLLGRSLKTEEDIINAAKSLLDGGIEVVVISMGPRGSIAVTKDAVWKAIPPEVHAESTIGAGDSLVAGLAIGIFEHSGLDEALRLGTAAATATVMGHGTELCRVEDVRALLPQVRVERVR